MTRLGKFLFNFVPIDVCPSNFHTQCIVRFDIVTRKCAKYLSSSYNFITLRNFPKFPILFTMLQWPFKLE